jgi:hypothetical protein
MALTPCKFSYAPTAHFPQSSARNSPTQKKDATQSSS